MTACHVPVRGGKQAMNHNTRRSREEATGTPKARQVEAIPSIILIDGASIIVIALTLACWSSSSTTRTNSVFSPRPGVPPPSG